MAFAASTILEVEIGGSDTANGGSFDPGNASMATDLAATSATGSSPVATSASYNFAARDVNAWLFVKAGTNWVPGWYKIASVAANAATLTASIGSVPLFDATTLVPTLMNTVAGCATTASPSGGTWSIDYSQQASPISYTDIVIDGTVNTKCTSAGKPFGPNFVGNSISVTSGTGFTVQRVQINSVTGAAATVDKSLGTLSSTGGTGGLGGALLSPAIAASLMVTSNSIFIKYSATAYTQTTSTANVAGGRTNLNGGAVGSPAYFVGYDSSRHVGNTDASRPIFRTSGVTGVSVYIGNQYGVMRNISWDNPAVDAGRTALQDDYPYWRIENCKADGVATGFQSTDANQSFIDCLANNCTNGFVCSSSSESYTGCVALGGQFGFTIGAQCGLFDCLSANQSGTGAFGFGAATVLNVRLENCTARGVAGATGDGFILNGASSHAVNCLAVSCGRYGFTQNGAFAPAAYLISCSGYGNGTANTADFRSSNNRGFITLTADPFTNAGTLDFTLNSTAGGGAMLRGLGYPAVLPGLAPANYLSVGVYQPSAGGGGSQAVIIARRRKRR